MVSVVVILVVDVGPVGTRSPFGSHSLSFGCRLW